LTHWPSIIYASSRETGATHDSRRTGPDVVAHSRRSTLITGWSSQRIGPITSDDRLLWWSWSTQP